MTKDPNTMAFIERYFTANEMLVALWIITGAVVIPIFLVAVYEAMVLHELKRAILDILTICVALPLLGVFNVSVMPDAMRANNGRGSSFFFDGFWAPILGLNKGEISNEDRVIFWKKHVGSDFLAGAWIFAVLGVLSVENRDKMDKSVGDASTKTAETASAKMTYAKAVQMQNTSVINDRRHGNSEEH